MEAGRGPPVLEDTECPARLTKTQYQQIAEDTVACCSRGWYLNEAGEEVALPMDEAVESTRLHPASASLPKLPPRRAGEEGSLSVVRATTLGAAKALVSQGFRVGVLNFASAKNPGGGFLRGANAQEEALARLTGLYSCLTKLEVHDFYRGNEAEPSCVYTDDMIVSPVVPVFKDDDGRPLDAPYTVGVLTAPAPNFGVAATRSCAGGEAAIRAARRGRMERLLTLLAAEDFDAVVLGAWGCGVFKNDPNEVAAEFRASLGGSFRGAIPHVVFAVVDEDTCQIFRNVMGGGAAAPAAPLPAARPAGASSQRWGRSRQEGGKADRKRASLAKRQAGFED